MLFHIVPKDSTNVRFLESLNLNPISGNSFRPSSPWLIDFITDRIFKPGRRPIKAKVKPLLDRAQMEKLNYRGRQIQTYYWHNDGPLVYLAHGWGSSGLDFNSMIRPLLESGFSVFTFDGVAHGQSEGRSTSFIEYVDLNCYLLQLIRKPDVMVGHSMGGAALVNASFELSLHTPLVLIAPMFSIAKVLEGVQKRTKLPRMVLKSLIRSLENRFERAVHNLELIDKVPSLTSPGLIIHDVEDDITYLKNSKILHENWPNSQLVETTGLGHNRIIKDKKVMKQIIEFINQNTRDRND